MIPTFAFSEYSIFCTWRPDTMFFVFLVTSLTFAELAIIQTTKDDHFFIFMGNLFTTEVSTIKVLHFHTFAITLSWLVWNCPVQHFNFMNCCLFMSNFSLIKEVQINFRLGFLETVEEGSWHGNQINLAPNLGLWFVGENNLALGPIQGHILGRMRAINEEVELKC